MFSIRDPWSNPPGIDRPEGGLKTQSPHITHISAYGFTEYSIPSRSTVHMCMLMGLTLKLASLATALVPRSLASLALRCLPLPHACSAGRCLPTSPHACSPLLASLATSPATRFARLACSARFARASPVLLAPTRLARACSLLPSRLLLACFSRLLAATRACCLLRSRHFSPAARSARLAFRYRSARRLSSCSPPLLLLAASPAARSARRLPAARSARHLACCSRFARHLACGCSLRSPLRLRLLASLAPSRAHLLVLLLPTSTRFACSSISGRACVTDRDQCDGRDLVPLSWDWIRDRETLRVSSRRAKTASSDALRS